MKLKKYNKYIDEEKPQLKSTLMEKINKAKMKFKIKFFYPAWHYFKFKIDFLNRVSFSIKFIIFLMFLFVFIFGANKLRFEYWKNTVIKAYPDAVQGKYDSQGNIIQVSPLDKIMVEFNARVNGDFFMGFVFVVGMFLVDIWDTINSPKPQVITRG